MKNVKRYYVGDLCVAPLFRVGAQVVKVEDFDRVSAKNLALQQRLTVQDQRVDELEGLLDTPHTADWFEGVKLEAGHQMKRWGTENDAGKTPADWFWLVGYLAQKAMTAQMVGDEKKARHHTISTGAAMLNWFRAIVGDSKEMRPGIDGATLNPTAEAESHDR